MRQARSRQFDPSYPPWLHCISRCVRRAFLCGDGYEHRKDWIERRIRLLARCFAVQVAGYTVMSNHLHLVLRPEASATASWSAEEVARAWWFIRHDVDPVDDADRQPDAGHIAALSKDTAFIERWRERLASASWFMKSLKEPLSRLANREDGCSGAFWEGRFTSVPLLDEAAVVACLAYVDLNPVRAGLASTPESSAHTSIRTRVVQRAARAEARTQRQTGRRAEAARTLRTAGVSAVARHEATEAQRADAEDESAYRSWLTPISEATRPRADQAGWSLRQYLALVDVTGRALRGDKRGAIPAELPRLLERLDLDAEAWLASVARPRGLRGSALGRLGALGVEAARRGMEWVQIRCPLFGPRAAGVPATC